MANSYCQVYIQAVFAVKYRDAVINKMWKPKLLGVLGNLISETGYKTIIVNGVEDHVHCFFGLKPTVSISDLMKTIKAKSSKFVNENRLTPQRFEWQRGFGAFSYNQAQVRNVFNHIANQEVHHQKQTFMEEYLEFLEEFKVEYDPMYLFEELL